MTVSAPPRPPTPARTAADSKPLDREEIEALVEALIEEARRETRRRHRQYWALAALVALVAVVVLILLESGTASQTASPALSARMSAAVQAGTSTIAFTSAPRPDFGSRTSALYVVNADGSEKRLLSRRVWSGYSHATWSPDGKTIAVDGLFINADGSGQRNVASQRGLNGLAAWSPDGRKIAFSRGRGADIYVMNADGSGLRRLTRNAPDAWHLFPMWSPNSRRIAFLRVQFRRKGNNAGGTSEVWVMNADGGGQRRLANGVPSAWSPDGQRIAFTGGPNRKSGLYVMNADGSRQRRLTDGGSAAWSPDGQKILFVRARPGTRAKVNDIYVMNADGTGQRNVSQNPRRDDRWPAWSPGRKK